MPIEQGTIEKGGVTGYSSDVSIVNEEFISIIVKKLIGAKCILGFSFAY